MFLPKIMFASGGRRWAAPGCQLNRCLHKISSSEIFRAAASALARWRSHRRRASRSRFRWQMDLRFAAWCPGSKASHSECCSTNILNWGSWRISCGARNNPAAQPPTGKSSACTGLPINRLFHHNCAGSDFQTLPIARCPHRQRNDGHRRPSLPHAPARSSCHHLRGTQFNLHSSCIGSLC